MAKRPKVIVVANNKGGVGKSLISQLVSTYLAFKKGKKGIVLDFDPQGNMSYRFLRDTRIRDMSSYRPPIHPDYNPADPDEDWNGISSALDMWTSNPVVPYPTDLPNLDILPSNASLIKDIEGFEYSNTLEEIVQRPYDFFNMDDFIECGYDFVLIDTPPAKGPLTQGAIRAATHVLIPLELSNKSLQGLAGMVDLVNRQNVNKPIHDQAKIIGLLKNKVDYNKRGPQNRIIETINANPILKSLLIENVEIHDSPRAVDIDEDQAPITAPYTELKEDDRFAMEAAALGEFVYHAVGLGE
ncbi:MAG: ParA family protein [Tatlockia sp.]|jgi:chromosome partitioning protein